MSRRLPISILLLAHAAAGCSATLAGNVPCSEDAQCAQAFGPGIQCGSKGFCREVSCVSNRDCHREVGPNMVCGPSATCVPGQPNPRCDRTDPADLFTAVLPAHQRTIVLGSMQDLSLPTKQGRERAAVLALHQANDQGGLQGRHFGIVLCTIAEDSTLDDLTTDQAAREVARYLSEVVGVPAIIGPSSSTATQAAFLEVRRSGTLVFSPSASSQVLTTLESVTPGLLWRAAPPDSLQAAAIANDMIGRGITNIAVVYEPGAYGEGLAAELGAVFGGGGRSVTPLPYTDDSSRVAAVGQAAAGAFQEVVFAAQTVDQVAMMTTAAGQTGFATKSIFVTDTAATDDFLSAVASNPLVSQVRGARPAPLDKGSDFVYAAFLAAYASEFSEDAEPLSFTAHAYDSAWMVLYGVAWAQVRESEISGVNIASGLRQLSAGQAVEIRPTTWLQVVEKFRASESVDIKGASGELDYDPVTEETVAPIEIWIIGAGGTIQGVSTWQP